MKILSRFCAILLLFVAGLGVLPTSSQAGVTFPTPLHKYPDTPETLQAKQLARDGDWEGAKVIWQSVAARNPNNYLGAVCLKNLAEAEMRMGRPEQALALLTQVAQQFQGTRFAVEALAAKIYYSTDGAEDLPALDSLVRSFGGPGLSEFHKYSANRNKIIKKVEDLPPETRAGLRVVYYMMQSSLDVLGRLDESIAVATFNRECLHLNPFSILLDTLMVRRFGELKSYEIDHTPSNPSLRVLNLAEGQWTGSRPLFKFEISNGDFRQDTIDLQNLVVFIDDRDMLENLEVRTVIDPSLRAGATFEKLYLRLKVSQRLAPGPHTLYLVVPTVAFSNGGSGVTRAAVNFNVQGDADEHSDEDEAWRSAFNDQ